MTVFQLIFREIIKRKLNFTLSLLAVVITVSIFVSFFTTGQASKNETIRLMRDIGFNLRIIPKKTDMAEFWKTGFSDYTMPESHVYKLASFKGLSYAHLTAVLQRRVIWKDMDVILAGISPEVPSAGREKTPMFFSIKPGNVYIGFEVARRTGLKKGEETDILGSLFSIEKVLPESGSEDDIRIYAHLHDVQAILGEENRINEIKALHCLCIMKGSITDSITMLREQLLGVLPDAKVLLIRAIAIAREKQRYMAEKYFAFIIPFLVVVCMAWIGILALINVRERRREIGIMRAVGYGSGRIAALFLGKAVLIGLIAAAVGYGIGTWLALEFGPDIFRVTANMIIPEIKIFYWCLIAAPLFCALSVFIPAMIAVTQDPAVALREK